MTIAALKELGGAPCPHCLIRKGDIAEAGTNIDMHRRTQKREDHKVMHIKIRRARQWVFKGFAITGQRVKKLIHKDSYHPIRVCHLQLGHAIT